MLVVPCDVAMTQLDLISSIHFQRNILANMMKCGHFLVDAFPRMRETKFIVLPVFHGVYSVVDCEIIIH